MVQTVSWQGRGMPVLFKSAILVIDRGDPGPFLSVYCSSCPLTSYKRARYEVDASDLARFRRCDFVMELLWSFQCRRRRHRNRGPFPPDWSNRNNKRRFVLVAKFFGVCLDSNFCVGSQDRGVFLEFYCLDAKHRVDGCVETMIGSGLVDA